MIEGNVHGSNDEMIYLEKLVNNEGVLLDSARLQGKGQIQTFSFKTPQPRVDFFRIYIQPGDALLFAIDSATQKLQFEMYAPSIASKYSVTGNESSVAISDFVKKEQTVKNAADSLKSLPNDASQDDVRAAQQKAQEIEMDWARYLSGYITANLHNAAVLMAMRYVNIKNDPDTFVKVGKALEKSMKGHYYQQQIALQMNSLIIPGLEAKDLKFSNPEGNEIALSSLRGKVVLIDFWASWCGPCRRENPNVVKLYHQYKDKGFTIYSVSLDQNMERWVQAIEQDKLEWPCHVSDLKGWRSEAAQIYGVSSIPFTVLIDQEGKIIQTHLRGQALEDKLAELFSE